MRRFPAAAAMLCIILASPAPGPRAWDAPGHRTIACLALATVDLRAAPWLGTADMRDRILFQSNQPDRLRSRQSPVLRHLNEAAHYFEIDSLHRYGLKLGNVPPLRRAYVRAIVLGSEHSSEKALPAAPPQYLLAGPGFLAHGAMEAFDLLTAALHQVRILEALGDPRRDAQLAQSRADVIHALGQLSHLVGDGSEPLHTTRHFNGWSGSNPDGFTRSKAFHRQVDSMPGRNERLSCAALLPRLLAAAPEATAIQATPVRMTIPSTRSVKSVQSGPSPPSAFAAPYVSLSSAAPSEPNDSDEGWKEILFYLEHTHAQIKPLYTLERDGLLKGPAGTEFVADRLLAGAVMLGVLLQRALAGSEPTAADIARFARHTERPFRLPGFLLPDEAGIPAVRLPADRNPAGEDHPPKEKPPARDEPGRRRD